MYSVPQRILAHHIAAGAPAHRCLQMTDQPLSRSEKKRALHELHRAWLLEVVEVTKKSPSAVAKDAGLADTTLTRMLNEPDYTGVLSAGTVSRIIEAHKVPGPDSYGRSTGRPPGFAEAERFNSDRETPETAHLVKLLLDGRPAAAAWRLKTSALEQAGYLPGDIVIVDLNAAADAQDAVCVQVQDYQRGSAETIWRVYDPPYLMAAANDRLAYKPLLADNERIIIKGVIVESLRPHRLSKAPW